MNKYQAPSRFVGKFSKYIESCESTNSLAFTESLNNQLVEGYAWVAGFQTAGKGQRGNQWIAQPHQNLLVSYLLKPDHEYLANQFFLSKAIALGIIQGIQHWAQQNLGEQLPLKVKWPNDIYLDGLKLGGILIENNFLAGRWTFSIVGVGLNINQIDFQDLRATSLKKWIGNPIPIELEEIYSFISCSIELFYDLFIQKSFQHIDEVYHENLFRKNELALFEDTIEVFEGTIRQVNEKGFIVIDKRGELKQYDIKELSFIFKE